MGWGKGKGMWHHFHHGPGPAVRMAEACAVGALAGATVATVAAQPRRPRPAPAVVVVEQRPVPTVVGTAAPQPIVAEPVAYAVPPPPKGKGKGKGKWGKGKGFDPAVPLGISRVEIPPSGLEKRGDVQFYSVVATSVDGGASWCVARRYNDFVELQRKLGSAASFSDAPFPGKHTVSSLLGTADKHLESRRVGLQVWLQRCVEHPLAGPTGWWKEPLRNFLEAGRVAIAADTGYTSKVASPVASAPPMHDEEDGEEDNLLEVQIPEGVAAGQEIAVTVPSGAQVVVTVPAGARAGQVCIFQFDPATGTLALVN